MDDFEVMDESVDMDESEAMLEPVYYKGQEVLVYLGKIEYRGKVESVKSQKSPILYMVRVTHQYKQRHEPGKHGNPEIKGHWADDDITGVIEVEESEVDEYDQVRAPI